MVEVESIKCRGFYQLNLGNLSSYRSELMGIATMLIIVCHAPAYGVEMPAWLSRVLSSGGFGVDIFLFLSGMGMYHSYGSRKVKGISIGAWWIKRYLRIILPCLLLIIPIKCLLSLYGRPIDADSLLIELFGFGFVFGRSPLWFITSILLLYILTPLIDLLLREKYKWPICIGLSVACFVAAYTFLADSGWGFMLQRWPSYFIGWALAPEIKEQKTASVWVTIALPLSMYAILYWMNHQINTHFSLFWLQGIAMVMLFAYLLDKIRNKSLLSVLSFMGVISLESYVTNEYLIRSLFFFSWTIYGVNINPGNHTLYWGGTLLCLFVSYLVNRMSKLILKSIKL